MKEAPVVHVGDRVRYHYEKYPFDAPRGRTPQLCAVVATVKAVYENGGVVLDYEDANLVQKYGRHTPTELHRMTCAAWFSSEPCSGRWSAVVWSEHSRATAPRFATASMDKPRDAAKRPASGKPISVWADVPKPSVPDDVRVVLPAAQPNKNGDVFDGVMQLFKDNMLYSNHEDKPAQEHHDIPDMEDVVTKDVLSSMGPFKLGKHILTHSHKYEKKSRDEGLELFQAAITNSVMTGAWRGEPASIKKTVSKSELVSTAYSIACDIARTKNEVTSTDVLAALRDAGVDTSGVDPRFIGAVFRKRGWRRVGSRACGSHGRSVSVWALG